ncbi:MAG: hypothetical protein LCH66_07220 [Actinobacteria bacterium]|nr:hypothetical protein [Actinomycetota bacterium]
MVAALSRWSARRWVAAALGAIGSGLLIALVTAMIDNPVFGRAVPTTWWAWPVLAISSVLSGLLLASYVRDPGVTVDEHVTRSGGIGGLLTVFAVGCPVCNKLVLLALGSAGAMQWFAPVQPFLGIAALALLAWGLRTRLRGEVACPVTAAVATE